MKLIMTMEEKKEMKEYFKSQGFKVTYKMINTWLEDFVFYSLSGYYAVFAESDVFNKVNDVE